MAVAGLIPAQSAQAKPSVESVQARVDALYRQAEQASERYNDARLQLSELQQDLRLLRADQRRQARGLQSARAQVRDSVVRQYEGQGLSAVGEVVVSRDPSAFLDQMATMASFDDIQQQLYSSYATQAEALRLRTAAAQDRADRLAALKKGLADDKRTIDDKLAEAKALLGDLKAEQRAAVVSRDQPRVGGAPSSASTAVPKNVPVSGRAGAAVSYALAQVGDAYVYGAAGPNAFDCSGLTMMAWAQAGVSLPHSSSAQYASGTKVAPGDLQPGDLVFYYSPISHVGIYIGNGQIVHAANPSTGVAVSPVFSMPFSGAVRPG
ncbi:C40 family peptidase [Nocardioides sp. TRM66260-LWL]|nr:C40 family peptidase [Nocardioides sp. TRM66260-LWL]